MSFEFEKESIGIAVRSIRDRKLRSVLTVVGIAIGVAAIISLVSIGEGTNRYINEQFEQFGANKILITPSAFGAGGPTISSDTLSKKDINLVKKVRGVDEVIDILYKTLQVKYKDRAVQLPVIGVDGDAAENFFFDMQSFELENGRFFKGGDRYVVVLGHLTAKSVFGDQLRIRDKFVIKDKEFTVVGILKEIGNTQDDTQIMMPLSSLRAITGESEEISYLFVSASNTNDVEQVAKDIQDKFDQEYGKDTFLVMSTSKLAEQVTTITSALSAILGGVAGIALLVAGIGISNTMYMSILERTKEIGIMKSIGATRTNIMEIFLMEAAIIGVLGGIVGILLGTGLSSVLGIALETYGVGLKTYVTMDLMALGMGFSVIVGVVSGFLPAKKAADMNPIEALRYE